MDTRVVEAVAAVMRDPLAQANPASVHRLGQRARARVEEARRQIACALGADALGVTFCSGGTEADNLAIMGAARKRRKAGRACGVLSSRLDHPAVLQAIENLVSEGHVHRTVNASSEGSIVDEAWVEVLRSSPEIGVVVLTGAHHELGNIADVASIAARLRATGRDLYIHCDGVQLVGKIPLDWTSLGIDSLAISGHKIYGPKGIGALVHDPFVELEALHFGGSQERGRRPGTHDLLGIVGLGVAMHLATAELDERVQKVCELREYLCAGLRAIEGVVIHGDASASRGNTVLATFEGCESELLLMALDLEGFALSTGAACSSGTISSSAALRALGFSPRVARSALRFSLGKDNSKEELDSMFAVLPTLIKRVRHAGSPVASAEALQ
jgi:cysteine desulfurase